MLQLENKKKELLFSLPQNVNEVSFEYVASKVDHIKPFKHYGLVAVIQVAKLRELLTPDLKGVGSTRFVLVKANYPEDWKADKADNNRFLYIAPSDVFTGIDCPVSGNELSIWNIRGFIESDPALNMSVKGGEIFRKVGSGSVMSLIGKHGEQLGTSKKLITNIAETVVCVAYKFVQLSAIQGENTIDGLPETLPFKNFINPLPKVEA